MSKCELCNKKEVLYGWCPDCIKKSQAKNNKNMLNRIWGDK